MLKELEAVDTNARNRAFELARRMLERARIKVAGAYLTPPFKRYEEVLEVV